MKWCVGRDRLEVEGIFIQAPILAYTKVALPFKVHTDASKN